MQLIACYEDLLTLNLTKMKNTHQNLILIGLTLIIILLTLSARAQLGTHFNDLTGDISEKTVSYATDTIIVQYNAQKGHVIGFKLDRLPAKWYFVDSVAVKIEMELTRRELRKNLKHLRKNWTEHCGYWQNENILVRIDGNLITVWYENK